MCVLAATKRLRVVELAAAVDAEGQARGLSVRSGRLDEDEAEWRVSSHKSVLASIVVKAHCVWE